MFMHETENLFLFHEWAQGVEVAAELADFLKEDVPRLFGKVVRCTNHEIVIYLMMIYIINHDDTCIFVFFCNHSQKIADEMEVAIIQSADHILNSFDLSIRCGVTRHCACSISNRLTISIHSTQLCQRLPFPYFPSSLIPPPSSHFPFSPSPHHPKQQICGGFYGKI